MIRNKLTSLILLGVNVLNFFLFFALILGMSSGYYERYYLTWITGEIFMPIIGGLLFIILTPTIVLHFFGKLRFVRLHKFMSFVDYGAIFGLYVAAFVLGILDRAPAGVVLWTLVSMISAIFTAIVSLMQLSTIETPKPVQRSYQTAKPANNAADAVQKLRTLKELLDQGIISEEEYNEKKKKYIELL